MKKIVFSAIAGALSIAAYAPLEWWWLMPLCIASLYFLIQNTDSKQAFYIAFAFGLSQFGIGASWVYVSLTTYGNMPMLMAAAGVLLFVSALAFFTGLIGYCFNHLSQSKKHYLNVLIFSCLWVIAEWLRSVVLTGFPWLDVGYSQTTQWLSGYAAIGSVYLVSFVCVCVSTLLLVFVQERRQMAAIPLILIIVIGIALKNIEWSEASKKSHDILLVQGNVPIQEKWKHSYKGILLSSYFTQMQQYSADLAILPETALPIYLDQTDDDFWQEIRGSNKAILAGIVERDFHAGQLFNAAALSCNASQSTDQKVVVDRESQLQIYRKQHLVPFGEYLPLRFLLSWILDYLQFPMADFSSGSKEQVLSCDGLNINLSICYEDAFAAGVRDSFNQENGILVNISEDAWFGDSLAPHQRVQMAQMRAQELSRPMLRSANSGPSTFIDFRGNVQSSTQQFEKEVMLVSVFPRTGLTPFARFGLWIVWISIAFIFALKAFRFFVNKAV